MDCRDWMVVSPGDAGLPEDAAGGPLLDELPEPGTRRYVMPAPGQRLALLAEFVVEHDGQAELDQRVERLMASFRWQVQVPA